MACGVYTGSIPGKVKTFGSTSANQNQTKCKTGTSWKTESGEMTDLVTTE